MKCIVKDCENHSHQGRFVGDLCRPCFQFISGDGGLYSQAYRNTQAMILQAVAASASVEQKKWQDQTEVEIHEAVLDEREACAKVCDEIEPPNLYGIRECAAAIRARGEASMRRKP